jgi:hypothetical protein
MGRASSIAPVAASQLSSVPLAALDSHQTARQPMKDLSARAEAELVQHGGASSQHLETAL